MSDVCACCGDRVTSSGGCLRCNSVRTYCACGALLACGCGRSTGQHACPNVIPTGVVIPVSIFEVNVF